MNMANTSAYTITGHVGVYHNVVNLSIKTYTHEWGIMMDLNNVVTLSTYAETHALDYVRLRRMARKNEFAEPFKFGKRWFIDRDVPIPVIPERKSRTRNDGRTRFVVYIDRDGDELNDIRAIVGYDNVVDMRDVRIARKSANADAIDNGVAK